jgi:hypothetical protein
MISTCSPRIIKAAGNGQPRFLQNRTQEILMFKETPPPAPIQRSFDRHFTSFLRPGDPQPDARRGAQYAQPVYVLGLEPLKNGQFGEPTLVSWRILMGFGSANGLYATVTSRDGDQAEFSGLSRGPKAALTLAANQNVRQLPQATENYELRLLSIPGLLTEAFWLKWVSDEPDKDVILPFSTAQKELQLWHRYSRQTFAEAAQKSAKNCLNAERDLKDQAVGRAKERSAAEKKKKDDWLKLARPAPERPPAN